MSTMTNYSPGPWTVGGLNTGDGLSINDARGYRIGHTSAVRNHAQKLLSQPVESPEAIANAHMQAASWSLYAVLARIMQDSGRLSEDEIAKATQAMERAVSSAP